MSLTLKDIAVKILHGELPPMAEGELAAERLKVCADCQHMKKMIRQCELCGCWLDLKSKLLEASCPINKW